MLAFAYPYECTPTIAESSSASACRARSSARSTARTRSSSTSASSVRSSNTTELRRRRRARGCSFSGGRADRVHLRRGADGSRARARGANALSHTGLRFVEAIGDSEERLHDLIASFVGKMLAAQKANAERHRARGQRAETDRHRAARGASRVHGLVRYRLRPDGTWVRAHDQRSRQPADGFTVAAYEYESDLEALCLAYEIADEEGRAHDPAGVGAERQHGRSVVNVDPEFGRILLRVVLVGGTIMVIGATGLYFALRAFAPTAKKGSDFRAVVIVIAVLAVVMVGCFVLLIFSYSKALSSRAGSQSVCWPSDGGGDPMSSRSPLMRTGLRTASYAPISGCSTLVDERARRRSAKRFAHAAHERRRNRQHGGIAPPTARAVRSRNALFEHRHEHFAMLHALRVRRESLVARQLRTPQHALAELREVAIRSDADRERPVAARERPDTARSTDARCRSAPPPCP